MIQAREHLILSMPKRIKSVFFPHTQIPSLKQLVLWRAIRTPIRALK